MSVGSLRRTDHKSTHARVGDGSKRGEVSPESVFLNSTWIGSQNLLRVLTILPTYQTSLFNRLDLYLAKQKSPTCKLSGMVGAVGEKARPKYSFEEVFDARDVFMLFAFNSPVSLVSLVARRHIRTQGVMSHR